MKPSARSLALRALRHWRTKRVFADQVVAETFGRALLPAMERAFALELFYGALRNLTLLDFWIAQLRTGPVEANTRDILRLGLYQIRLLDTAAHAAVFETVELAPRRARSLVNAVLRRALREKAALTKRTERQPLHVQFSEPQFLVTKWEQQFGKQSTLKLCAWNNRPPPIYVRVNQLKTTASEFLARYPGALLLPGSANFATLPEPAAALEAGHCYVQDPSTAIACELLRPLRAEMVLDACAAPGGKSGLLAEMMANEGTLVACDYDETRVERLESNLVGLGLARVRIVQCNWLEPDSIRRADLAAQSFDKILVDAPCTNTGAMRRRVDVRWRLRPADFLRMQEQQRAILRAVAPLLKAGGSLVYSTCSLEPEENEQVVGAFLRDQPAFRPTNRAKCLPFRDHFDGAFAARLECGR